MELNAESRFQSNQHLKKRKLEQTKSKEAKKRKFSCDQCDYTASKVVVWRHKKSKHEGKPSNKPSVGQFIMILHF